MTDQAEIRNLSAEAHGAWATYSEVRAALVAAQEQEQQARHKLAGLSAETRDVQEWLTYDFTKASVKAWAAALEVLKQRIDEREVAAQLCCTKLQHELERCQAMNNQVMDPASVELALQQQKVVVSESLETFNIFQEARAIAITELKALQLKAYDDFRSAVRLKTLVLCPVKDAAHAEQLASAQCTILLRGTTLSYSMTIEELLAQRSLELKTFSTVDEFEELQVSASQVAAIILDELSVPGQVELANAAGCRLRLQTPGSQGTCLILCDAVASDALLQPIQGFWLGFWLGCWLAPFGILRIASDVEGFLEIHVEINGRSIACRILGTQRCAGGSITFELPISPQMERCEVRLSSDSCSLLLLMEAQYHWVLRRLEDGQHRPPAKQRRINQMSDGGSTHGQIMQRFGLSDCFSSSPLALVPELSAGVAACRGWNLSTASCLDSATDDAFSMLSSQLKAVEEVEKGWLLAEKEQAEAEAEERKLRSDLKTSMKTSLACNARHRQMTLRKLERATHFVNALSRAAQAGNIEVAAMAPPTPVIVSEAMVTLKAQAEEAWAKIISLTGSQEWP
jgi:hypothetical protein